MALRNIASLEHTDDEMYDLGKGMPRDYEPPAFPPGCCFTLPKADLEKADAADGEPGDSMHFSAMGEVTSIFKSADNCRIELSLLLFAGDDGEFFALSEGGDDMPWPGKPSICLCGPELEKMDLDADCERGDLLHVMGTARLESCSSNEWQGDICSLQITDLAFVENESDEQADG